MKPAVPAKLPIASIRWEDLIPGIGRANRALARYDGLLAALPNADILLAPMATQEAVLSSRIEGTQATFGEILKADAGEPPAEADRELDVLEVVNYRRALRQAIGSLDKRPFSLNLLRGMHVTLLDSVRGQDQARGRFRSTQNWIGPSGSTIESAYFVPPEAGKLPNAMSSWEKYYHADAPDALVQLAVIHGQFEFLHPFL
ncbi:MAG TPA: Fic/DOC family N-terminal domain-containing protein, partial [Terriglobales bacterium]|nr:Fic/DOC family N-terminal domain-containing protein [Terriglobales bacterium]